MTSVISGWKFWETARLISCFFLHSSQGLGQGEWKPLITGPDIHEGHETWDRKKQQFPTHDTWECLLLQHNIAFLSNKLDPIYRYENWVWGSKAWILYPAMPSRPSKSKDPESSIMPTNPQLSEAALLGAPDTQGQGADKFPFSIPSSSASFSTERCLFWKRLENVQVPLWLRENFLFKLVTVQLSKNSGVGDTSAIAPHTQQLVLKKRQQHGQLGLIHRAGLEC